jgi:Ca-activated chloride channel homolog
MKKLTSLLCLMVMAFCLNGQSAEKAPVGTQSVLFILDGSGSMWQKLDGEYKIVMAKSVMKNLVEKLPAGTRAGLIAYGHNRKSDCEDIETLVPLDVLGKAAFKTKLDAINPMGKTPIAKSINHALALLRSESGPVTVILVSDGLETCDGDACDLVKKAKAQGVKITMHVVGFGIEEQDLSALECIAQAGGGQYLPANNAEELTIALDKTVEEPEAGDANFSIKVTLHGKLLDGGIKIFKQGAAKETAVARTYEKETTNPRLMQLPAGLYRAEVSALPLDGKPMLAFDSLDVKPNDTLYLEVDFSEGTIEVLVTRNGELSDAVVHVYKPGATKTSAKGRSYTQPTNNPAKYRVLPGIYFVELGSVEINGGASIKLDAQLLKGGETISFAHDFKSGELSVGARQGATMVDAVVHVYSKKTGKIVTQGRTYSTEKSNPKLFTLEPEEYKVVVKPLKPKGLPTKTFEVEVKAKERVERTAEW